MLDSRLLAQERAFSTHAVQHSFLDQTEDRLSDRRERDPELGGKIALGRKRPASAEFASLDHPDQKMPHLKVQRHWRVTQHDRRRPGGNSHLATV
jgi:hypothetical protein